MSKQQENTEVEARWKEFWHDHKDFESSWARAVLHSLSEFLPFVFKFAAVPAGLKQLYLKSDVRLPRDFDWATDWTDMSEHLPATALSVLPIFKLALAFRAYAYYGLKLAIDKLHDFHGLDMVLEDWEDKQNLFPREWGYDQETEQTFAAAVARRKLDHGQGLTPDELAALAQVSRKSVMNLVAPGKSGVLQKDSDDRITAESARRWLLARPDFRPSIWQQQKDIPFLHPAPEPSSVVEPLFVPVAADGSWLSPADRHQRDDHYHVGNGDDERTFDDYWTALDFLARAASPRWRYSDTTGRWRIKTATGWERKARQEVEDLLSRSTQIGKDKKINDARRGYDR